MKVIVAGSRSITDKSFVFSELNNLCESIPYEQSAALPITELVCGLAEGPDKLGKKWAEDHEIDVKEFPANWDKYGKTAGIIRNKEMGDYADALVAFWDGKSRGTKHMIDYMLSIGKEVHVYAYKSS